MKIPLAVADFGHEEILECMDSLLRKQVTMGEKVRRFEAMWAERIGLRHCICVNSGSSANLIATAALRISPGNEVIVPATTWSTTIFPLVQYGLVPVFADIDETLCLDPESVERAISDKTEAIVIVPLLGSAYDPKLITYAANEKLTTLIDACEAHGATIDGRDVGSYGYLNTWSFFLSHHITTIEGGMVGTDDAPTADILRGLRAHGWVREMDRCQEIAAQSPEIDSRFLFAELGYNLRPTELTASFGLHQVPKLGQKVEHRRRIADRWATALEEWKEWLSLPTERDHTKHSFFGFPIIVRRDAPFTKKELVAYLQVYDVDTRPIMAGDIRKHPVFQNKQFPHRSVRTPTTDWVYESGFFVGLHTGVGHAEENYFLELMETFLMRYR